MITPDPSGIVEGITAAGTALGKGFQRRAEATALQRILAPQGGAPQQNIAETPAFQQQFANMIQNYQNQTGVNLTPQQLDMAWNASVQNAQAQQQAPRRTPRYTPQQIMAISQRDPQLGAMLQREQIAREQMEQKERLAGERQKEKRFQAQRQYELTRGQKGAERIESTRTGLGRKRTALEMARTAVQTGNVGAASLANIGRRLGIPELQTASGAALITASKENLLSNMSRVSARAQNVWFEKRLNDMFAKIGQKKAANLTATEILEGELLLDEMLIEKYDQLAAEDMAKYGYKRGDLEQRAYDAVKPSEDLIFNRTLYKVKQLMEGEDTSLTNQRKVGKQVDKGTMLTIGMAKRYIDKYKDIKKALQVAKKNGYTIPTRQEMEFYEKSAREVRGRR